MPLGCSKFNDAYHFFGPKLQDEIWVCALGWDTESTTEGECDKWIQAKSRSFGRV